VIAALVNGVGLVVIALEIFRSAIERFQNPEPVLAGPMLIIALIGLAVNVTVALVLRPHGDHDHDDLNTRAAFLHVLGDTLASVGVILAGILILYTEQQWIDPLVSLLISLLIMFSAGRLLLKTVHILVEGMPEGMRASDVAEAMQNVDGVVQIHDLHIWTVSPGYIALSAHVVLTDQMLSQSEGVMEKLKSLLSSQYQIDHTTIQFECEICGQGKVNNKD
jgi:cobalt-zinc-cadmium efflux system protein